MNSAAPVMTASVLAGALVAGMLDLACGKIVGIDDYRVGTDEPSHVGYFEGASCEACLEKGCKERFAWCKASADCQKNLACQRSCSGPSCVQRCTPGFDTTLWYCARQQCSAACAMGSHFECTGKYGPQFLYRANDVIQVELAP